MKRLLIFLSFIFVCLTFAACNGAMNPQLCADNVKKAFPNCVIYRISNYRFMAVDTSLAKPWPYYIETDNITDAEVSRIKVGDLVK